MPPVVAPRHAVEIGNPEPSSYPATAFSRSLPEGTLERSELSGSPLACVGATNPLPPGRPLREEKSSAR
jgi:hypothetical protein